LSRNLSLTQGTKVSNFHIFSKEKGKYVNQDVCSRGKRKEKTSAASVLVGKFLKGWKFPSSGYISFPGLCGPKEKITR